MALSRERLGIVVDDSARPGDRTFLVEIADTDEARGAGLMCRKALGADEGMLFVYPRTQIVRMWMKNTYIALDMLFIAPDGRITKIVRDVAPQQPGRISSDTRVRMVLELPAGSAASRDIRVGDRLRRPKPSPPVSG